MDRSGDPCNLEDTQGGYGPSSLQILNSLLSIGIYFVIEDKDIQLNFKLRSCFMGIVFFLIVFIRGVSILRLQTNGLL